MLLVSPTALSARVESLIGACARSLAPNFGRAGRPAATMLDGQLPTQSEPASRLAVAHAIKNNIGKRGSR
jgi:hypothetical protein